MRKKLFTFLLALVASVGMSWATSQPVGYVDVCTAHPGSIHLVGWANDPDALGTSLPIHVYVDQPNGGNSYINEHGYNLGTTDVWREDGVNPQYTGYHKIDRYINIMEASGAGTYRIRAYALDAVGNDGNPLMPHSYLGGMPTTATLTVPAPYSITYNANGGNGAPAADYKCYGINKTLSSTVPTRDGYTFIGWNTEQNGSGTSYAKGATYSANASATLYAQWKVTEVTVNLSTITSDYVIPNGATLTGTLQNNVKLTVADNATITLSNVNINWNDQWTGGDYAGLTCNNATIILADCSVNRIKGFLDGAAGIHVLPNYTLTIEGNGTLYTATHGGGAGIGCGYGSGRNGGNIVINGGTIYATGGNLGAGIGAGGRAKIGNITINGGIITATGGGNGAGIGCGQTKNSSNKSQCGNITITNGVKYLKATKGSGSDQCIGKGSNSGTAVCGTVTINGTTGAISTNPYTYSPAADNVKNLINAIGSVAYTQACKDKIDAARAAYEALADNSCDVDAVNALKAAVSNYSTLTNAEATYADLMAVKNVEDLINAIGSPITAASQTAIDAARNAYNALTGDQQALVGNYATLTDAEAALAVVNLINAIGSPITAASQTAIDAARNAYDALTNAQKSYVDNYATLTDAEAAYAALTPSADPTIFAGFTATAGCGGFGGEDHYKLVDGLFAPGNEGVDWTKWCADGQHKSVPSGESESCWWVDFNAANPIAVTGYILTTGNDNTQWGEGRNPNTWKIKAKLNENDPWTTIANVQNDNTMQVADFTDFSFTLDQAGTYKYFRFMVYEPEYDNCMQLCEFRFTGNGGSTPEPPSINDILQELYNALGNDVWAGYGDATGVITYAQGTEPNSFKATFMGGAYAIEIPFGDFTQAEKVDNGNGTYTYNLDVNLPAQTGLSHEVLHVTVANGEIQAIHSDIAQTDMNKVGGAIATWADLNAAMANGGVLQLSQSLTAEGTDGALIVPAGKTVVLDLNGFSLDRHLTSAQADGCVIINNGTLAITDNVGGAEIKGGYNSGNGGGIVNNGTFTLYGGKITANHAAQGAGVYNTVTNNGTVGFWMTGGLIAENSASSYPAIKGDVTFSNLAVVQINAGGNTVSAATAIAGLATYDYIKPVMPNMDMFAILAELHNALGNDVWAGYGDATGVITYAQGTEPNSFKATFMGGAYAIEIPFGDFTQAEKVDNGNGTYTYNLDVNLPAQTGLSHEVLHVTVANGEIQAIHSDIAQTDMNKVGGAIASWADLNAAMANGGVLQLSQSLTATNLDGALVVPAGKTVVLDLNGFSLDRHLGSAQANGCVIINNGTLAITDNVGGAEIKGGYNSGNGGGIVNNGTFTLYGGKITGNHAAQGAGVYNTVTNNGTVGFWMTGGLIAENSSSSYPAIKGDVTFSNLAVVQINAQGATVSATTAIAGLATYDYIKPVMPNMDMFAILAELHAALGSDVWTGYGTQTGVISYAQGDEPNSFKATFMGGTYEINIPFGDFTSASKMDNGDGTFTYDLVVNLPAQTGMSQETLHVTTNANGEILEMESENAGIELQKETDGTIATWADLQNALNNGGVIKLTNDIVGGNAPLEIPAGKTVVLDLNGHTIDRGMTDAAANGSVIVNNGTLAIVDNSDLANGVITGGNTTGNGGGILNNGILTLYGGEITGNAAAIGGGVYNNGGAQGFWMTGGLIDGNTATTNPAIGGEVIFNENAAVQINAQGAQVTIAQALAGLATYSYIKPVMPNYDELETDYTLLLELYNALGNDVWTGYGVNTGVISYKQGTEPNSFNASFMGGTYSFDLPFEAFTSVSKADNGDGTHTYTLVVNLPAQTGMGTETLHVTMNANGEITEMDSENAGIEMQKEEGPVTGWTALQAAMNQGGVIKLGENVIAESTDAALVVPADKTVVLELNGFTINRNLNAAVANGSVIVNNGTLAILGEGQITGGKTTGNGGGVLNNGIFTLYAGEITGNAAAIGGGVYNNGGAQGFWMTGGLIDNNTATTNPAIGGDVIFNSAAVIQINADGDKVSIDEALAGLATYTYIKPVMPSYDDYTTEVAIAANADPHNANVYYSTFYDSANKYALPAGVEAYVADLSGSDLVLTKIAGAGQVIPAGEAVILRASLQNFSLLPSFEAPVSVSTNNDLEGVDAATPVTDIAGLTLDNCYVLSGTTEYGVGFYKINGNTLKAHKAYVKYVGSQNGAPRRMRFIFNQATDIDNASAKFGGSEKILRDGQLIIIKNGVRYNVQGQIVK